MIIDIDNNKIIMETRDTDNGQRKRDLFSFFLKKDSSSAASTKDPSSKKNDTSSKPPPSRPPNNSVAQPTPSQLKLLQKITVGTKLAVYWPDDNEFYPCVVTRHRVRAERVDPGELD